MGKKKSGDKAEAKLDPVFRTAKHVLTSPEKADMGERLGRLHQELGRAKLARVLALADCKEREDGLAREVGELSSQLVNGYVLEEVECDLRPDYTAGIMEYVRRDTGDVVHDRPLFPVERQESIL